MASENKDEKSYQFRVPEDSERQPDPNDLWNGDCLQHSRIVPTFANMIAGQNGPLTIGLNARWGSGKTYFLKHLLEYYVTRGGRAVYFNAWADDFISDPLVSLACQLRDALGSDVRESIGSSARQAVVPILKHAGLSIAKSWIRNKIGIDLEGLSAEELESRLEKIYKDHSACVSTRDELKKALDKLGREVKNESRQPLLVIVDELDRCRPTYAIELLERIKHLFCIENIVFVLGIDKEQLGKSIAAVYGDINVEGYLHRFVDVEMGLPVVGKDLFVRHLLGRLKLSKHLESVGADVSLDTFTEYFIDLSNSRNLTPREIEQALRKFSLIVFAKGRPSRTWVVLAAAAVVSSLSANKDLYLKFVKGQWLPMEMVDAFFESFDLTCPATGRSGAGMILYLYKLYYFHSGDESFVAAFDAMLENAAQDKLAEKDYEVLPKFAIHYSAVDIRCFFKHVLDRYGSGKVDVSGLLKDLDEAMHTINEE